MRDFRRAGILRSENLPARRRARCPGAAHGSSRLITASLAESPGTRRPAARCRFRAKLRHRRARSVVSHDHRCGHRRPHALSRRRSRAALCRRRLQREHSHLQWPPVQRSARRSESRKLCRQQFLRGLQDAVVRDVRKAWLNSISGYQRLALTQQLLDGANQAWTWPSSVTN